MGEKNKTCVTKLCLPISPDEIASLKYGRICSCSKDKIKCETDRCIFVNCDENKKIFACCFPLRLFSRSLLSVVQS